MSKLAAVLGSLFICTGTCIAFFQAVQIFVDSGGHPGSSFSSPIPKGTDTPPAVQAVASSSTQNVSDVMPPLDRASERITKKPFGIFVSPTKSPVSPERFSGYHTGTDFETVPDEQERDVHVHAICEGKLLRAGTASGYGGYAVQSCMIKGQDVTVMYGHLRASSFTKNVGDVVKAGEILAVLGKGYSGETDGERKHLHLGIVKGKNVNIHGYVSDRASLASWIDYQSVSGK
jgi:murein DD-endopeptidase MepM/ murein hydrolase activator NlpD